MEQEDGHLAIGGELRRSGHAPRTDGGRVARLSPYETVMDGSVEAGAAAQPHTPSPAILADRRARGAFELRASTHRAAPSLAT
eukprot:CAMPEP_0118846462 /NCGR_PEP_ID=MMETSP1162-20130426/92469_1 /TAXON_ID=33656 /ORGANISM="Phaeocystis Sp, Strain CCMP2710" /LENGTH=82 /DNA_ID=CAMNT_0006778639 /DNA_START=204 /DNA_END=449 /DNA_ORIENTATION=-